MPANLISNQDSMKPKATPVSAAGKANPQPTSQPVSERFPALEEREIILTFFDPEAREVQVAGNFNGWHPEAAPPKTPALGNGLSA